MQIWTIAIVIVVSGGIGGFANALNAGDLHLPHRAGNVYSPGWIGNVIIGAIAAVVWWGLYGPMAKVALIGESANVVPISMTFADVAGAILTWNWRRADSVERSREEGDGARRRITSRSSPIRGEKHGD